MRQTEKNANTNTTMIALSELVMDYDLYPRVAIDTTHVAAMREAYRGGVHFPPIVADAASKRITDGFHRTRVWFHELGQDAEVAVILKPYKNDAEMFLDAMRLNAAHGKNLSPFDRARCAMRCRKYRIGMQQVAAALGMSVATIKGIAEGRVATSSTPNKANVNEEVVLKRTIQHMSGKTLTQNQEKANERLSGMQQIFYVNQVLLLVENNLLDLENESLMIAITKLGEAIQSLTVPA